MSSEILAELAQKNSAYAPEAYLFVLQAMRYAQVKMGFPGHLSGQEFSKKIVELARELYGMLAISVFEEWGIRATIDFGQIVYDLIDIGHMSKQPDDSIEDFRDVFKMEDQMGDAFDWDTFVGKELHKKLKA